MQKRQFLNTTVVGALAGTVGVPTSAADRKGAKPALGPTLLTVSGLVGAGNRGALNPAHDQLMAKQKLAFEKAQTFDFAALAALPAVGFTLTVEYDRKQHTLAGPLLTDVAKASGVVVTDRTTFFVRAIDGYAAPITAAEAAKRRFIVATHLDGTPMPLGGLGPLWTVYEADRFPDMAARPLPERFGSCPWATYHIEVREA